MADNHKESRQSQLYEEHPMNGGDGLYSYTKNSSYQRSVAETAESLIKVTISEKLTITNLSAPNTYTVADLGCSVGPNTFFAVQNIIESVQQKYQNLKLQTPEFTVFFNDHVSNDFNTLFRSIPTNKPYQAAGVPGSFYSRLFPRASVDFAYSSFALHWLSKVPEDVVDEASPAWNKGRIHYSNAADEVVKAYSSQFAKDMDRFLEARAQEIVGEGLMVIIVPARPNGVPHSEAVANLMFEYLGSCVMAMAKKGVIDEEKVDSFNIPIYYMSPQELEAAVDRNGCFTIDRMESLPRTPTVLDPVARAPIIAMGMRAGLDSIFGQHFELDIVDEIFESFEKKLAETSPVFEPGKSANLFACLKRKSN